MTLQSLSQRLVRLVRRQPPAVPVLAVRLPEAAAPPVAHPGVPFTRIGLDHGATGAYEYRDYHQPITVTADGRVQGGPARTLTLQGVHYEHVADDADGIWLYRQTHI